MHNEIDILNHSIIRCADDVTNLSAAMVEHDSCDSNGDYINTKLLQIFTDTLYYNSVNVVDL